MSDRGDILNDSHAEVMCRRGFMRYLYEQINFSISMDLSIFKFNDLKKKFELIDGISFHMFTTHSPCGDASIFSIDVDEDKPAVKKQRLESTENDLDFSGRCIDDQSTISNITGAKIICNETNVAIDRMIQSAGKVRIKPGRGSTLSLSCSDKLAKWNVLGVQGNHLYQFLDKPIYIASITFCDPKFCDISAMERALWKRFSPVFSFPNSSMTIFQPKIRISQTTKFQYEKNERCDPSPSSIVWCKVKNNPQQVAVAGKRQGMTKKKAKERGGRLLITKIELFREYLCILKKFNEKLGLYATMTNFNELTYLNAKNTSVEYQNIWNNLKTNYFKVWSLKDDNLKKFKID